MNAARFPEEAAVLAIEGPSPKLFTYYPLSSLLLGPLFFIPLIPLYFRYHTLRYRFDEEGISMRCGILFRREINLTYTRIQDIHLRSNVVERWLDLARIEVQTASGSSGVEMTLEGLLEFEAIRTRPPGTRMLRPTMYRRFSSIRRASCWTRLARFGGRAHPRGRGADANSELGMSVF